MLIDHVLRSSRQQIDNAVCFQTVGDFPTARKAFHLVELPNESFGQLRRELPENYQYGLLSYL